MGDKSEHIKVYMTEDMKQQVQQMAENHELDASTYIRSKLKSQITEAQA